MQAELKLVEGELMAQLIRGGEEWIRLPEKFRVVEGHKIRIRQWINPKNMEAFWVLNQLVMSMMCNDCLVGEGEFKESTEDDEDKEGDMPSSSPYMVYYDRPVLMHAPNLASQSSFVMLLSSGGYVLAGSNIYGSGWDSKEFGLCLGDEYDPWTSQPAELLLTNKANSDLDWKGGALEGEWKDSTFNVEIWPTLSIRFPLPPQIIADLDALSQS
jgi:hypothetical protein